MEKTNLRPDYLFEISWEICNQIGGIHRVLSSKALNVQESLGDKYVVIGPDVWRDSTDHPEFEEDADLFKEWQEKASAEGLFVRTGRWKIESSPVAILIDFTTFFNQKDEIFSKLWEQYKLDSISGQWDYIEPTLFGYAAGLTIESFVRFHGLVKKKVVAHFHEWLTGAGLLYLKEFQPQIGTVFTAHSTIVGRRLAESGEPFYSQLNHYNGEQKARDLGLVAKQSLERITAHQSHVFSTVSDITANECEQFLGKSPDLITPNGFQFDSKVKSELDKERPSVRAKLLKVVSSLTGAELPDDTLLIGSGGRYEFRNKGMDVLINSLEKLNNSKKLQKPIVVFLLVPAQQYGARNDLIGAIRDGQSLKEPDVITHYLHFPEHDPILKHLELKNLGNQSDDMVKVVFVPAYLRGADGIFNLDYFEVINAFDLTVFPSYYEPWGYTPMESIVYGIPSVTTALSGYGRWIKDHLEGMENSIYILERNDHNTSVLEDELMKIILKHERMHRDERDVVRKRTQEFGVESQWQNLIDAYWNAYSLALEGIKDAGFIYDEIERVEYLPSTNKFLKDVEPQWRRVVVQQQIPERLKPLEALSKNIWWSWNKEAVEMFRSIDPELWDDVEENPILLLDRIPYDRLLELERNEQFMTQFESVINAFKAYMSVPPRKNEPSVAYYSMEFGLHNSLKIYSGGLGLLAGDYLKEASDYNYSMVGVGLLYRYGYFHQVVTSSGEQIAHQDFQDFSKIPVVPVRDDEGNWISVQIILPGRTLHARVWKTQIGRIPLYLLDADYEANKPVDRTITHELYGGDDENRFKQELLLGIGGVRVLRKMGIYTDLYHLNEGHAAFTGLERLREYIQDHNLTFPEAREVVRSTSLFTTHTPVPAGHDSFHENMMRTYLSHYPERLTLEWNHLMNLGKKKHDNPDEKFSMSVLAVNLSQEINGVSKLHGAVSRKMFSGMWKGYLPEELHIGHVTNGVHLNTWVADRWRELYLDNFGEAFFTKQDDRKLWEKIYDVPDDKIMEIRNSERKALIDYIRERLSRASAKHLEDPTVSMQISESLNDKALTIGFARRFATYKRANLLFTDLDRLSAIVNNEEMPVQFVFAGKAHPKDIPGQQLIKRIVEISKMPEFVGKIIFLQNYNINLAKKLLHGVDIWLNTPTRPLEASGTSGEKSVMNGGLHFSVLDGWWAEGYKENAGWALPLEKEFESQDQQNSLDAGRIYSILENDILPAFYKRDKAGNASEWVNIIKNSISKVAPEFTMNRMLRDYIEYFYRKLYKRSLEIKANDYKQAKDISFYKKQIIEKWTDIKVLEINAPTPGKEDFMVGEKYKGSITIDLNGLSSDDIGVEMVVLSRNETENQYPQGNAEELKCIKAEGSVATYEVVQEIGRTGQFDIGYRVFPKLEGLPHRMDLPLLKWV